MKLVVDEDHSGALRRAALAWDRVATSELAITEVLRAVRRHLPSLLPAAEDVLAHTALHEFSAGLAKFAARLDPVLLRSIDAIHLATALSVRAALVVSYDRRMLDAADRVGLVVASPGR